MYIIIVGAGDVGFNLAETLVSEGHDVVVIENNEKISSRIDQVLDAMVIQGSGLSRAVLNEAGIRNADLFIAATRIDEVNLVSCTIAQKAGPHSLRTVARIKEIELYTDNAIHGRDLGISLLIGPRESVVEQIMGQMLFSGSGQIRTMADGHLSLLELPLAPSSPLVNKPIASLREELPMPSLIVGVYGPNGFRIPDGKLQLSPDERVDILTPSAQIQKLLKWSSNKQHTTKHVLILGAGATGIRLARRIEHSKMACTVLEADKSKCENAAKVLNKSNVIQGDPSDTAFLKEQMGVDPDAVFVDLDDDEKNVLLGLFAKQLGAHKVIVLSNKLAYTPLAHKMGIDAVFSPQLAMAKAILQFIRQGNARFMLGDHDGEVLEIVIPTPPKNRAILEHPLSEIDFPDHALLGAVSRDKTVFMPNGKTILESGDKLFIFVLTPAIQAVEKLFQA